MNSSDICRNREVDKSLAYDRNTPIDGPEKVGVVTKSMSLQEMGPRSLRDISECESSRGGKNSSGVFSCSMDISDVCMADLTKLSDSTCCSLSDSVDRSNAPRRDPNVASTPLSMLQLHEMPGVSPSLTPIRSQTEFLSPQFGASDDYLRRNINFIHKQLSSLLTQLVTEDKYFQTCSKRYEEIITELNDEISILRNTLDDSPSMLPSPDSAFSKTISQLMEECKEKDLRISRLQNDLDRVTQRLSECGKIPDHSDSKLKDVLNKLMRDILPSFSALIQSTRTTFPDLACNFEYSIDQKESSDFQDFITMFDKCLTQINEIISLYVEANFQLSTELGIKVAEVEEVRMKCDNQNESLSRLTSELDTKNGVIAELNGKMNDFKVQNDSLKVDNAEFQTELATFKTKTKHLEDELVRSRDQYTRSADQMVLSTEERLSVDRRNSEMKTEIKNLTTKLAENNERLARCQNDLDSVTLEFSSYRNEANSLRAKLESEISEIALNLSRAKRQVTDLETENSDVKHACSLKEMEVTRLRGELKELEREHKKLVEESRIKGSGLILENSKLKEELENLHKAFGAAQMSAEKSTERFDELQKLYMALNEKMETKETNVCELASQKTQLEGLLRAKEGVLVRLCSNFNELLVIFRECQDLGLDHDSSAIDIDDGFIRLKRRLLDLSQDYITLNNRNKVLEKEASVLTSKLNEKEEELVHIRRKCEKKCDSLRSTIEKMEAENKALISQKIEQEDGIKKLQEKLLDLELLSPKGCHDCGHLRTQLQQLQIDLVDKDATISTLELHIQSCCEHNRKKAQQYKHELRAYKRQLDAHTSYAGDFGLSPKKSKGSSALTVDVGTQAGESFLHHLSGGFVERFKILELEEKVIKLEKERTVLKRLCKIRSDRIHELELTQDARSLSSNNSTK